jgi:hypothetical protein
MRIPSRTPESARQQRREQSRRDRAAAQTLRSAFPAVERIRVELKFRDAATASPAGQSHVMHPPARAFFEFPCPYADCDGKFDLSSIATLVMAHSSLHAEGTLECDGVRSRDGLTKQPCGLRVDYTVAAQYQTPTAGPTR